jgi:hypothetical protein
MKNQDYLELFSILDKMGGIKGTGKFAYAVYKNHCKVQPVVKPYFELMKPSDKMALFEDAREELCKKYAEKDDDTPIMEGNQYKIQEKCRLILQEEINELKKSHPEVEKEMEEINKKVTDWLEQEVEPVELHKVIIDDLPDMTPKAVQALDLMIEEHGLIMRPNSNIRPR